VTRKLSVFVRFCSAVIIVIDEIHTLVGAGAAEGARCSKYLETSLSARQIPMYWSDYK
jgi:ATP-dependent Clp protease ATP-binding subunit ClpA